MMIVSFSLPLSFDSKGRDIDHSMSDIVTHSKNSKVLQYIKLTESGAKYILYIV